MKRKSRIIIGSLFVGFFTLFNCEAKVTNDHPLVWDVSQLQQIKQEGGRAVRKFIKAAEEYYNSNPVAITDKENLTVEPNKHFFCSIGPYWWPDSLNTGKYVNRDGVVNPESKRYDNVRLSSLITRCKILSQAFYLTENVKYYEAFVRQLKVWFVDKESYMYPTFEYSQVIPGQRNNKGRSTGMISAYGFNTVIESIRLVNGIKKIDKQTMKGVQKWFCAFANDSEERYGKKFKNIDNNISLAFDVTMVNMFLFAGKDKKAKKIADEFAGLRIERQILEDGRQPAELKRTQAFGYSVFNLTHIVDFCYLARYWYSSYYQDHRGRIDKAFEFLGQYSNNPENFPYQQISDWDKCKRSYQNQLERIEQLKSDTN